VWEIALVGAVCAAVYWPMLGATGLSSTEGHRAIPGWAMLQSGDWLRVTMFELGYLRKPPGMPWAVACSSAIFGETEFAARAVSAAAVTLMSLLCLAVGTRWFGRPWGVVAGLACALMPQYWSVGRAAEIEALNNLGTLAAAVLLIELALPAPGRRWIRTGALALGAAGAVVLTSLAKGPASAPVLAAAPVGACIAARSARGLLRPGVWGAAALSAAALAAIGVVVLRANAGEETVRQGVSDFLWSRDRALQIATLLPTAFGAAMPASAALLLLPGVGRGARREGSREPALADAAAWTWVVALAAFTAAGVSNSRYAMPAAGLLPLVAAYVAREGVRGEAGERARGIVRALAARRGMVALGTMLAAAAVFVPLWERQRMRASGRAAGEMLGTTIARGVADAGPRTVELWADEMVETRPEVLLYAARAAAAAGVSVRPIWAKPAMERGETPAPGEYLLLKTDGARAREPEMFARAIESGRLAPVAGGTVHEFEFVLYRSVAP